MYLRVLTDNTVTGRRQPRNETRCKPYNPYKTVDRPPQQHGDEERQKGQYRSRYSIKHRIRNFEHEAPDAMKQYKWKPYKTPPRNPADSTGDVSKSSKKSSKKKSTPLKSPSEMTRRDLFFAMQREHPLVTLNAGTLSVNIKEAWKNYHPEDDSNPARKVHECLQEAVRLAADAKRSCQKILGRYLDEIFSSDKIEEADREFLDHISARISADCKNDFGDSLDDEEEYSAQDLMEDNFDPQCSFISMLMRCLYSKKFPNKSERSKAGPIVRSFMQRLQSLGIIDNINEGLIVEKKHYPASSLLRSVSTQLYVEIKKIYKNGTWELFEKVTLILSPFVLEF